MPATLPSLLLTVALFFGSLLTARFVEGSHWYLALYPLALSLGSFLWLMVGHTLFALFKEERRALSLLTLTAIAAIILAIVFLPPVAPPKPDPFLPSPPTPLDWRTIFSHMLPLPTAVFVALRGITALMKVYTGEKPLSPYFVSYMVAVGTGIYAMNRCLPRLPFLYLLGINLAAGSGTLILKYVLGRKESRSTAENTRQTRGRAPRH